MRQPTVKQLPAEGGIPVNAGEASGLRLSPQQRHLWALRERAAVERAKCAVLLVGPIDSGQIQKAWRKVVERHEILRTTFRTPLFAKEPLQTPMTRAAWTWQEIDLSLWPADEQEAFRDSLFRSEPDSRDEPDEDHPLHVTLATLAADRHLMLFTLPALCADFQTLDNLYEEFARAYENEQGDADENEPTQYAQFAEWQNEMQDDEDAQAGKAYWQQQDLTAWRDFAFPFESRALVVAAEGTESFSFTLAGDLVKEAEELTRDYQTSLQTFLLTCWQILIAKLARQRETVISQVVDGRKYDELRGVLGPCAKYLATAFTLESDLPFAEVLQQIEAHCREAVGWEAYFPQGAYFGVAPQQPVAEFLPYSFAFDKWVAPRRAGDALISMERRFWEADLCKLQLLCHRDDQTARAELRYHPAFFQAGMIERLAQYFTNLVEQAVRRPAERVADLQILNSANRHELLVTFNQTDIDYPQHKCIHELFEVQAESAPDRIAVACEAGSLTYAELNRRANQLANYLIKLGVGPEAQVGLVVERSVEMVVGILGVLKAGGAYLPLDPSYPKERLNFILSDTKAPILLAQQRLLDHLPGAQARVVCLDAEWELIARESGSQVSGRAAPDALAYTIYTSGSTGAPKGVPVTHRNLVASTHAREVYYPESVKTFLLLSSFAFDSSVAGIFWTLWQGGTLLLPDEGFQRDVARINDLIERFRVSHILCLPSLYSLLLDLPDASRLRSLETVIVAGEACSQSLVDRHLQLVEQAALYNEYGPTEATVWCAVYRAQSARSGRSVPIGRPIPNSRIHILDDAWNPAAIGLPGEVYVGGAGIARGYLNRPELTAERFIPNPYGGQAGSRLYKTGDLARYLPDGDIELIGRSDQQVKVRGYRIELGEVEAIIGKHPAVREVAVVVKEDEPGEQELVAYLALGRSISRAEETPVISEARRRAQAELPSYMVPNIFVALSDLPVLPNGKVDRRALPAPERRRAVESEYIPPGNALEERLAGIWKDVLNLDQVGVEDNFFDLGGHSFAATRVHARLYQELQREIPLLKLFEHPTIRALARFLDDGLQLAAPYAAAWAENRKELLKRQRQTRKRGRA